MPETLDFDTLIVKLREHKLDGKFRALVDHHALLATARDAVAKREAEQAAEQAAQRRANEPIIVPWAALPGDSTDMVVFCAERRPHAFTPVRVNNQLYVPALPNRPIGFLEAALRPALPATASSGWSFGTIRDAVYPLDRLGPAQAASVVQRLASDAVPLLICIYRAYAHATTPPEKSLATLAYAQLAQFGNAPGSTSVVPAGERDERRANEATADRIWAMATADAPAKSPEVDRETAQRHLTGVQLTNQLDKWSDKADRDAAKAAASEAQ